MIAGILRGYFIPQYLTIHTAFFMAFAGNLISSFLVIQSPFFVSGIIYFFVSQVLGCSSDFYTLPALVSKFISSTGILPELSQWLRNFALGTNLAGNMIIIGGHIPIHSKLNFQKESFDNLLRCAIVWVS